MTWIQRLVAPWRRLPIRWRLTLWSVALLTAALLAFSAALYSGLRKLLYDSLDDTLRSQAALTLDTLQTHGGVLQPPGQLNGNSRQGEHFIRVFDWQGNPISDTSTSMDGVPIYQADVAAALAGNATWRWIMVGGEAMRVLTEPVKLNGQVTGVLQVGAFASDIGDTLGTVVTLLLTVGPLVLLAASLGSYVLAGHALAPVDRITRLATEIGGHDLTRRVDLRLPRDEVGRLAQTFNAMLDRLETAFRRQRQFTADASHELRTPLSLLQAQLELALARPRDSAEDQLVLESLAGDVERVARLANMLLALARSDAGALALSLDELDLTGLIDLVAEQYTPLAAEAGVGIVTDVAPVSLRADGDRLLQVLVNLVDNALRHSPAGGTIVIGCRASAESVRCWVADQGTGIPPEHLPHIFERFYRVEAGRDRASGGIGLGLSISKEIVEAHGGTIAVESASGVGTTFTITLPRRHDARRAREGDKSRRLALTRAGR